MENLWIFHWTNPLSHQPRLVLVLGSAVTRYRYTEPCELGDAGESQVPAGGWEFWWLGT
jgi:hypothetical protein